MAIVHSRPSVVTGDSRKEQDFATILSCFSQ